MRVESAIAGLYTRATDPGQVPSIVVYLSSVPDVCSLVNPLNQYPQVANSQSVTVDVFTAPSDAPGTFTNPGSAGVSYGAFDGSCTPTSSWGATAATVQITSVTPQEVTGTFDGLFASGGDVPGWDRVTGSFTAVVCPALSAALAATAASFADGGNSFPPASALACVTPSDAGP
jgi:hypothetical protein